MNNNLISIIVPIYNSEKYLNDLFKSIDNQNFKDYELLLINDGSIDNSEKICKEYIKTNKRAKYFYKKNSGVSDTRNFGISKAVGEYLCFVDSDDVIDSNFLSSMYNLISQPKIDLGVCKIYKFQENINPQNGNNVMKNIYKNKYDIIFSEYGGYLCNKIFKRDIIVNNNILLNVNIYMCEDMLFLCEYLKHSKQIAYIDNYYYYYRIFNTSSGKDLRNIKWFTVLKTFDILRKYNINVDKYNYCYHIYLLEAKFRLNYIKNFNEYEQIKKDVDTKYKKFMSEKNCYNIKQKIKIFLYTKFNKLSFKIRRRKYLNV